MEKSFLEGNKLIAEFMGAKFNNDYPTIIYHVVNGNQIGYIDNLLYHSSWDWLMPVVEKIEGELINGFGVRFELKRGGGTMNYCKVYHGGKRIVDVFSGSSKIECLWLGLVEFIQWHNTTKPQPNAK